jgi:putative colanic acid biosynthesis acetyltransferase WcaF
MPGGFRGRPAWVVQLWWFTEAILFRPSPQVCYAWRRALLRLFGAQIGRNVIIRPTARFTYPWKISIGDFAWIGDDVTLYSLGPIQIGAHTVISQHTYVCAGDHDYEAVDFPIRGIPTTIGSQVWLGTGVFVAPGTRIADGAVVGARSTVTRDVPAGMVCVGTPARPIKRRGGSA